MPAALGGHARPLRLRRGIRQRGGARAAHTPRDRPHQQNGNRGGRRRARERHQVRQGRRDIPEGDEGGARPRRADGRRARAAAQQERHVERPGLHGHQRRFDRLPDRRAVRRPRARHYEPGRPPRVHRRQQLQARRGRRDSGGPRRTRHLGRDRRPRAGLDIQLLDVEGPLRRHLHRRLRDKPEPRREQSLLGQRNLRPSRAEKAREQQKDSGPRQGAEQFGEEGKVMVIKVLSVN